MPAGILSENLRMIKERFATLVSRVAERLENAVNIDKFRLHVTTLFQPGDVTFEADSITKICTAISKNHLWDYNSPSYIKSIVKEFAPDMMQWVLDYESDLMGFKVSTKIANFIEVCSGDDFALYPDDTILSHMARYDRRYCCKLCIKLKTPVKDMSLIYVDHLWKSISEQFLIEPLLVLLERIREGCVEVTWYIPTLSALQILAGCLSYNEFFQEQKITRMICDKETLYIEEMNEVS